MKIKLKPLYSKLNSGVQSCPLGCQSTCKVKPYLACDVECPLSTHQVETYKQITQSDADIIFNTSATGDGKSLAGDLPGLLNPNFRTLKLYPTIELIADQEDALKKNIQKYQTTRKKKLDSIYGAELAKRINNSKRRKFDELRRSFKQNHFVLTNPDIFHLVTHYFYYQPAYNSGLLPYALAIYPHLYVCDEFHIFGEHEAAAILNSLLFIRHSRQKKNPLKILFTSATPKQEFINSLKLAGFKVARVGGNYSSQAKSNYRAIAQESTIEFVSLKESDTYRWLIENTTQIRNILEAEGKGRGLVILNSLALVDRVMKELPNKLGNSIIVKEISSRIDRQAREKIREELREADKPVLLIATSAVDVGVDFKIHLLIFEVSDSATFIQRLGRLGRHPGFSKYQAFALIPDWMNWIVTELAKYIKEGAKIDRTVFREEIIDKVFQAPQQYKTYRNYWGALQAQGMLFRIGGSNERSGWERKVKLAITQDLRDLITASLRLVYGDRLDKKRGHWFCLGKEETGQAIQQELLKFRGSASLQVAVWSEMNNSNYFYTTDLLRLLPYNEVEVIDRQTFLKAATNNQRHSTLR